MKLNDENNQYLNCLVMAVSWLVVAVSFFGGVPLRADSSSSIGDKAVQIKGTAAWQLFRLDGNIQSSADYSYVVLVSSNGWSIKLTPVSPQTGPIEMAASDNLDTYRFIDNSYVLSQGVKSPYSNFKNQSFETSLATIHSGPFPADATKALQVLWFTFLYSDYSDYAQSNSIALSGINYQITSGGKLIPDFEANARILQKITYHSRGSYLFSGDVVRLDPPLDQGFTLWEIAVLETTNVLTLTIPQKVRYTQFFPGNSPAGSDQLSKIWVASVSVQNIETRVRNAAEVLLPDITNAVVSAIDYRFTPKEQIGQYGVKAPVVVYKLDGGHWLNREQASVYGGSDATRFYSSGHKIPDKRRWVVLGLLFLTMISPLILYVVKKTKKQDII